MTLVQSGRLLGIGHVELRVRDLDESVSFYEAVLGLSPTQEGAYSRNVIRCVSDANAAGSFGIVLTRGLPAGLPPAGMDHLSFHVAGRDDVDEIHHRAVAQNARVTSPRNFDGSYQVYVFDPNGYKIEVAACGE